MNPIFFLRLRSILNAFEKGKVTAARHGQRGARRAAQPAPTRFFGKAAMATATTWSMSTQPRSQAWLPNSPSVHHSGAEGPPRRVPAGQGGWRRGIVGDEWPNQPPVTLMWRATWPSTRLRE
jgi:hypothetical protein